MEKKELKKRRERDLSRGLKIINFVNKIFFAIEMYGNKNIEV